MVGRVLTLVILLISYMAISAQSVAGDWEGILEVQGTTLKVIFHINEDMGEYNGTMDSPNQGAFGIKMDEVNYEGEILTVKNKQMGMTASLDYLTDRDVLEGTFKQGPMQLPLKLSRIRDEEIVNDDHPLTGKWHTSINAMGNQLRLILHVSKDGEEFKTLMDSPDQGAFGIEMQETVVDGEKITIASKNMGLQIKGTYVADSNLIKASFRQGPLNDDITLKREEIEKQVLNRPQEPKSFDYPQEEVTMLNTNGGHTLAGTLTIPKNGGFEKVVVLVTGSGPQDRNEELLGHKPFLVLSDYLTRNGIAVLRYDDRGVGNSTGDFGSGTSMDFAQDAAAAVDFLRSRSDMKGKKIGIMGHSEGGLIAPVAAQLTNLDFTVLLAGPGIASTELLLEQTEAIMIANKVDAEEVNFSLASSKLIFQYMKDNPDQNLEELKENMKEILRGEFAKLSDEQREEIGDIEAEINTQVNSITSPWFRYFIAFDPAPYLSELSLPTLAVNGSLDVQVLPKSNLQGIQTNLQKAGNENYTIHEFEGLNHLFQMSADGTGSPNEYGALEETFNEEAMAFITDWVHNFDQ